MPSLHEYPFQLINSTSPSFNSSAQSTGAQWPLEDAAVNRVWQFPGNRVVRVASIGSADFHLAIGSSTLIGASTDMPLFLGGTVELLQVRPSTGSPWVSVFGASTDVIVNFTLGYGR